MNKTAILVGALTATLACAPVWADSYRGDSRQSHRDYAKVVDVTPIVETVRRVTPRRECWTEEVTRYEPPRRSDNAVPVILGGILGGAIGHQFGHGHGNRAATVAGTLIGATIAADAVHARGHSGGGYYTDSEERCRVIEESASYERTLGYDVTYRYRGETYTTRMDHDPGPRIAVEVSVRPAY